MSTTAVVLDCYTVEPSGLGVPPYLSTYVRDAYSALRMAMPDADVRYLTIGGKAARTRSADATTPLIRCSPGSASTAAMASPAPSSSDRLIRPMEPAVEPAP